MVNITEYFKALPWTGYLISGVIVSIGALVIYAKDAPTFIFEEYLITMGVGWSLVFMLMIFFSLFFYEKN